MLKKKSMKMINYLRLAGTIVILLFVISGCSALNTGEKGGIVSRMMGQGKSSPLYYDFGDVLIPGELKVDKGSSFIYRTPGFTAGVVALKGRVDISSLISFFDSNMPRDGWRQVSSFRSPRTILLFQKESRWCVIIISEGRLFTTRAEVWVAPTNPMGGTGEENLLK